MVVPEHMLTGSVPPFVEPSRDEFEQDVVDMLDIVRGRIFDGKKRFKKEYFLSPEEFAYCFLSGWRKRMEEGEDVYSTADAEAYLAMKQYIMFDPSPDEEEGLSPSGGSWEEWYRGARYDLGVWCAVTLAGKTVGESATPIDSNVFNIILVLNTLYLDEHAPEALEGDEAFSYDDLRSLYCEAMALLEGDGENSRLAWSLLETTGFYRYHLHAIAEAAG